MNVLLFNGKSDLHSQDKINSSWIEAERFIRREASRLLVKCFCVIWVMTTWRSSIDENNVGLFNFRSKYTMTHLNFFFLSSAYCLAFNGCCCFISYNYWTNKCIINQSRTFWCQRTMDTQNKRSWTYALTHTHTPTHREAERETHPFESSHSDGIILDTLRHSSNIVSHAKPNYYNSFPLFCATHKTHDGHINIGKYGANNRNTSGGKH